MIAMRNFELMHTLIEVKLKLLHNKTAVHEKMINVFPKNFA